MAPGARNFAALSLLLAACGAPQSSPSGVEKRSAECAIGAADELRRAGDLDGALALLQQCPESSTAALAAKMDLWIVLGDLDEARRAAMDLAKREPSLRPRAEQVLALPEVDETSGDARSLISASRATRDPAERRALLARARHLFVRLAGAPGRPVLLRNQGALGFAGNTPVWMVGVHELPVEGEPASLIALAAPDLERHVVSLERLFPEGSRVVEWPGHPEAVIVSTPLGGVRVVEPGSERSLNVQGQPLVSPQPRCRAGHRR